MPPIDQPGLHNRLLRQLPPVDFARLAPHLEPVELRKQEVLVEPDQPCAHATFPERGIGSIVTVSPEGQMIESGLFGRDGLSPASLALGADRSPHRIFIQAPGEGHRVPAQALREAMAASPALRDLLLRYAQTLAVQTAYTALSNAVHCVDERLARWLLMCHDRAGDQMALTHEFLGIMLAVRRPSVTTALHVLEGNGFIRATRGLITVRDRQALEEFARPHA